MTDLTVLLHEIGQDAEARSLADRALRAQGAWLDSTLPTLTEREQIALMRRSWSVIELALDLSASTEENGGAVYSNVLDSRGLTTDAAAARRAAGSASKEARALLATIPPLRTRLSRLYDARVPETAVAEHGAGSANLSTRSPVRRSTPPERSDGGATQSPPNCLLRRCLAQVVWLRWFGTAIGRINNPASRGSLSSLVSWLSSPGMVDPSSESSLGRPYGSNAP